MKFSVNEWFTISLQITTQFDQESNMSTQEGPKVHPLQNEWVIFEQVQFHQEKDKKAGYTNSYESICKFKTVEGFWMNWNRIPTVT